MAKKTDFINYQTKYVTDFQQEQDPIVYQNLFNIKSLYEIQKSSEPTLIKTRSCSPKNLKQGIEVWQQKGQFWTYRTHSSSSAVAVSAPSLLWLLNLMWYTKLDTYPGIRTGGDTVTGISSVAVFTLCLRWKKGDTWQKYLICGGTVRYLKVTWNHLSWWAVTCKLLTLFFLWLAAKCRSGCQFRTFPVGLKENPSPCSASCSLPAFRDTVCGPSLNPEDLQWGNE